MDSACTLFCRASGENVGLGDFVQVFGACLLCRTQGRRHAEPCVNTTFKGGKRQGIVGRAHMQGCGLSRRAVLSKKATPMD